MTLDIEVQHLGFAYQREQPVLRDVSFAVKEGSFLAVVGPNGAGKSTLINLIAGMLKPQEGEVLVGRANVRALGVRELARKIAVVRQEFVPAFAFSVAEVVLMARTARFGAFGFERSSDRAQSRRALELTDTADFAARPLGSLSAGERQRVFIARALAQDSPILLMDEPTSYLDMKHQVGILDLLKTIQLQQSRTIIAVTHDINLAAQYCDLALLLEPATTTADGSQDRRPHHRIGSTSEVFTAGGLANAFGVRVFSGSVGREDFFIPLGKMAKDAPNTDAG